MQLIACVAVVLCMLLASGVLLTVNSSCTTNVLTRSEIQSLLSDDNGVTGQHSSGGDQMKKRGVSGAKGKKKKKKAMNNLKETDKQQSLFVHQTINCTGQLTKWIFAAKWQNNKHNLPELQVWRLASADSTYNKIHSTTVNVNSENTEKIYEFTLSTPIDVIAGDVLSVFQPKKKESKLIMYFHEGGETDKYMYYLEKTDNSISAIDIRNTQNKVAKPLITAVVISQVLISSTSVSISSTSSSTSVSIEYQSSSTVQVRTDVSPLSSSQRPVLRTSTTINRMISSVLTPSVSLVPSPTTTSLMMPVQTTTPCMQTCSTTRETHSETIHSSWVSKTMIDQTQYLLPSNTGTRKLSINSATVSNTLSTTPTSCINTCTSTSSAVQSSFMLKSTNVQANSTSVNGCDEATCNIGLLNLGTDDLSFSNSVIVLVIIFATIFTCGMTIITVCVLCVIVFLFKKKKDDNEIEMMSYPGSKQNRYIQKTVTSPMYEGIAEADPSAVQQLPPPTVPPVAPLSIPLTINEPHVQINNINKTPTLSSVGSSCPSVTVQPDVIVNIKQSYDHLSAIKWKEEKSNTKLTQKTTTTSNPVSPYEKPVLPDEACSPNVPIGYYELADEIYVPTEDQRQMVTDIKGSDQESLLYKSLYEAQHETTSSDDDDADKRNESKGNKEFFKETQEYWKPSYTKQAIYQQLANKRFREVPRHKIQVIEYLGSGQFATVNKAMWKMAGGDVEVAVKMIKEGAPEEERIKFLREAAINGQFHHLNVVRLLGVVTVGEPTMIILELLRNGNLKKYLTSRRKPIKGETVSPELLLNFSKQVCSGMEYLAKKTFVHRDVAARNVLVSDQLICKVADFGMSRDLEENSYYVSQGGLVPIKWTAPEALYYRKFSTASDVWSYGVLLFEIWSFGKKPYSTVTNEQYIDNVDEGKRLAPPPGCPRPIYQMMIDCWHPEASERPTFTEIYQQFESSNESLLLSLGITDDELVESPQCDALGAPLESGSSLFLDLQMKYYNM